MRRGISIVLVLALVAVFFVQKSARISRVCNDNVAKQSTTYWIYTLVDPYEFGSRIQRYVESEDLQSLFGLVKGELNHGPRKKSIQGKSFSDVFSKEWKEQVLSETPPCSPQSLERFYLGNGEIWYDKEPGLFGEWYIISMNGAREIEASKTPVDGSWKYNGELLTSECFMTEWISGDNSEFFTYIGRYIGGPVTIEPIVSPWGKSEKLFLAIRLSDCVRNTELMKIEMYSGWVVTKNYAKENCSSKRCLNAYYHAMRVPINHCRLLAPYFAETCLDLRLVQISRQTGGSMGNTSDVGIYGIIKDPTSEELYVAPLVNFYRVNDALNYVDLLEQ